MTLRASKSAIPWSGLKVLFVANHPLLDYVVAI